MWLGGLSRLTSYVSPLKEIIMAADVYKIQNEEIKPDALYNAVLADSDGAVTTFAGVVRDNTKGRGTSYLVYDAYIDMAKKKNA